MSKASKEFEKACKRILNDDYSKYDADQAVKYDTPVGRSIFEIPSEEYKKAVKEIIDSTTK